LRRSDEDRVTLVGAGVTLIESLKAADQLAPSGVSARVIDAYSVKPIDAATLREALAETGLIVTVEDHWAEGGLGDAVLEALAGDGRALEGRVIKIAVRDMPGSGAPEELRDWAGISATKIAGVVRDALA
jgi:transketolase